MKQTFTVTGMHCGSCGMLVDETLEDLPGVRNAQTDVRHGRTVVDGDDVTAADIVTAITALGFQATAAAP